MKPIRYIQALLFTLGFYLLVIAHCSFSLLFFRSSFERRYWAVTRLAPSTLFWLRICCGITYHIEGMENIPDKPMILLSNHNSTWETLAFQILFPAQCTVLKQELLKIPVFGWALRLIDPIAIDRSKPRQALQQLIKQGKQRLEQGRWITLFPEGTRVSDEHDKAFGLGGAQLAAKSGIAILPVAHNAGSYWSNQHFIKKPGTIRVVIGKPIEVNGKKAREINEEVSTWIKSTQKALESNPMK